MGESSLAQHNPTQRQTNEGESSLLLLMDRIGTKYVQFNIPFWGSSIPAYPANFTLYSSVYSKKYTVNSKILPTKFPKLGPNSLIISYSSASRVDSPRYSLSPLFRINASSFDQNLTLVKIINCIDNENDLSRIQGKSGLGSRVDDRVTPT